MNSTYHIPLLIVALCASTIAFTGQAQDRGVAGTAPGGNAGARKYAVIVGLNDYTDSGIGTLKYAVADAEAIHQALSTAPDGFKPEHTVLLSDNQPVEYRPTRSNILKYLSSYINLAGPDDTILVYFAGHGTTVDNRLYLLPSDASISLLEDTSIAFERVKTMLEESPAKRKVLLLDACHSGAGRSINRMSQGLKEQLLEASKGMVTLASCGPEEVSHEMDESGHGAFTYFLLEGLTGKADANADGLIGAKELSTFTWDATRVWAAGKGLKQNPWDLTQVSGDIVLAKVITVTGGPKAGDVDVVDLGGGVKLELVYVPGGTFQMGSSLSAEEVARRYGGKAENFTDEHPQHEVTISRGFWMGKYEVTNEQWRSFADAGSYKSDAEKAGKAWVYNLDGGKWEEQSGASWRKPGWPLEDRSPVVCISWNDAQAYCTWLSGKTQAAYRLPSEAEWEYACRGGTQTPFPWGADADAGKGWLNGADTHALPKGNHWSNGFKFDDGYWSVSPVGTYRANSFGLHDMQGNVREWCGDWYGESYYGQTTKTDPSGLDTGKYRVLRGGSWFVIPRLCRSAIRIWYIPTYSSFYDGFRVVRVSAR